MAGPSPLDRFFSVYLGVDENQRRRKKAESKKWKVESGKEQGEKEEES